MNSQCDWCSAVAVRFSISEVFMIDGVIETSGAEISQKGTPILESIHYNGLELLGSIGAQLMPPATANEERAGR